MSSVFTSVDFRLGNNTGRTATAENAADREHHYRGGSALRFSLRAHIGQLDPARLRGHLFSRRMI
nr:MAG TPA: hypothetical protein [Caudoviricetes sp.]